MTDTEIVYQDMQQHGPQDAWDWQADLRFAWAIGASAHMIQDIQELLRSDAPFPLQIAFHRKVVYKPITTPRLRALRKLIRDGRVCASWRGTGTRGVTDFGVNRVRHYELVEGGSL